MAESQALFPDAPSELPSNSIKHQIRKTPPISGSKSNVPSGSTSPLVLKIDFLLTPYLPTPGSTSNLPTRPRSTPTNDTLRAREIWPSPAVLLHLLFLKLMPIYRDRSAGEDRRRGSREDRISSCRRLR